VSDERVVYQSKYRRETELPFLLSDEDDDDDEEDEDEDDDDDEDDDVRCKVSILTNGKYATWVIKDPTGKIISGDGWITVFDETGETCAKALPMTLAQANMFSSFMENGQENVGVRLALVDAKLRLMCAKAPEDMFRRFCIACDFFISYGD